MDSVLDDIFKTTLEIHRSVRHRFIRTGENQCEVNPLQLFALFAIHDQKGITMRALASALQITPPSATSFANRLVKYGWIKRKKDEKNRKIVRLFTTKKGEKSLADHLQKKSNMMKEILSAIPGSDQKELLRILKTLYQHLSIKK